MELPVFFSCLGAERIPIIWVEDDLGPSITLTLSNKYVPVS